MRTFCRRLLEPVSRWELDLGGTCAARSEMVSAASGSHQRTADFAPPPPLEAASAPAQPPVNVPAHAPTDLLEPVPAAPAPAATTSAVAPTPALLSAAAAAAPNTAAEDGDALLQAFPAIAAASPAPLPDPSPVDPEEEGGGEEEEW